MSDLLKFHKHHKIQNKREIIARIRTEIMRSLAKNVYDNGFSSCSKNGEFLDVNCNVVIVDSKKWSHIVNQAYQDRKALEDVAIRIDTLCRELKQYPYQSDEIKILAGHIIDRLTNK